MPVSPEFERRLDERLKGIAEHFGTPFYLYDERGIVDNIAGLHDAFSQVPHFREFYAVKAVPNHRMLGLLRENGAGFDCGAVADISVAQRAGAMPDELVFTSNNTTAAEFDVAIAAGAVINIDDLAAFDKLPRLPERVGLRLNPGSLPYDDPSSPVLIDSSAQKFGLRPDQLVEAVRLARERGATRFGLHAMVASGPTDGSIMRETLAFLLKVAGRLRAETGTVVDFIDTGGGLGIPFRPGQEPFDVRSFGAAAATMLKEWATEQGAPAPSLFLESGRYVTGPHGVLVARVINRMDKWQTFVGVDTGISAMIRPAMYDTAYHHLTVHGAAGRPQEVVDVVGSMCENTDKLATQRPLPRAEEGDLVYLHDVGAHGWSMAFPYNNKLRPAELLLRIDGSVELIRRAETEADLFATLDLEQPNVLAAPVASAAA